MIILVPKDSSLQELFNGILSSYISSIVAEISLYISYNIKPLRNKKVEFYFSNFHTVPPRGFLRTFFCHSGDNKETKSVEFAFVAISVRLTHIMTVLLFGASRLSLVQNTLSSNIWWQLRLSDS